MLRNFFHFVDARHNLAYNKRGYYFLKETFNIKNAQLPLYVNFTSFIGIELYRRNNNKDEYSYNDFLTIKKMGICTWIIRI